MAVRGLPLQRGQVVVARSPVDTGRMVVKRVTALPGDAVRVRGDSCSPFLRRVKFHLASMEISVLPSRPEPGVGKIP